MSIKETIELDVKGLGELKSAADQAERLARAISKSTHRSSGDRIAESNAKSANRLAEIAARRQADTARSMDRRAEARAKMDMRMQERALRMSERQAQVEARQTKMAGRRASVAKSAAKAASGGFSDDLWGGIKQGFGMGLADMAISAAKIAGQVVLATGKAVLDAQAFRESTTLAMKAYLGSSEAANSWFDNALKLSEDLKQNAFDTIEGMSRLRAAGFDDTSVTNLTKAFADIKRLSPDADLKSVAIRLAQIRATGKLQGDELNELANAWPAARDVIFKEMMKDTGKTQAELVSMQRAGKITPEMVEKALLGGVSALTKMPLGEFSKANADTVRGLIDQIMAIPSQVLLGFDASGDMDRVKGVMKEVVEFFSASSESGKEVRTVMKDLVGAFVEGLFGVDVSKTGGVKETLQALLDVVKGSKSDVKEFAAGIAAIGKAIGWIAGIAGDVSNAKQSIVDFFGYRPPGGIWGAILLGPLTVALNTIKGLAPGFYQAGADLINGLINGITGAVGGVIGAAKSAASSALSAVRGVFQSHSPSRAGAEIGGTLPWGIAVGVSRETGRAERAAADMASRVIGGARGVSGPANTNAAPPVARGAAQMVMQASASGGRVVNVTFEPGAIVVQGSGTVSEDIINAVREAIPRILAEVA